MIVFLHKLILLAFLLGLQLGLCAQTDQSVKGSADEASVSLHFPDTPMSMVLSFYESVAGVKVLRDANAEAVPVSIVSSKELTKDVAIRFIEKSLAINGYILVPSSEGIVKLSASSKARDEILSHKSSPQVVAGAVSSSEAITLDFPQTPLSQILLVYEDLTGLLVIREARSDQGVISVVATEELNKAEAIKFIEKRLLENGCSFLPAEDGMVVLLNKNKNSETNATSVSPPRRRQLISTPPPQPPQQ